jgi:protein-S-isoprenylcysteine O-methyltransferase Ste14
MNLLDYRPPRIAMAFLGVAALLHWLSPLGQAPIVPSAWLALVTGITGFLIMMQGWRLFRRDGVAICPTAPTRSLITDGIYRLTRNPMYLGILLMLVGTACWFGTLPFVAAAVGWWSVMQFVFCPYEEQKLEANFGDDYRHYRARVRRWVWFPRPPYPDSPR